MSPVAIPRIKLPDLSFDGRTFALAWQAVAEAAALDADRPVLYRATAVEFYRNGVRLVATDGYVLLTAWIPTHEDQQPELDEAPKHTVIARDSHGRGRGLMSHILKLTKGDDAVQVRLDLSIEDDSDDLTFDGFGRRCITFDSPLQGERLRLELVESDWVTWRDVVTQLAEKSTKQIALNGEIVGRLAKVAKVYGGLPIVWRFGGHDAMAGVEIRGSDPFVWGVVMPVRLFDPPAPDDPDEA